MKVDYWKDYDPSLPLEEQHAFRMDVVDRKNRHYIYKGLDALRINAYFMANDIKPDDKETYFRHYVDNDGKWIALNADFMNKMEEWYLQLAAEKGGFNVDDISEHLSI